MSPLETPGHVERLAKRLSIAARDIGDLSERLRRRGWEEDALEDLSLARAQLRQAIDLLARHARRWPRVAGRRSAVSGRADVQALALRLAAPALAHDGPNHQLALYGGGRRHTNRRVVYERHDQHLFGRWTEERITIEVDDQSWLDRHENTNQTAYGRGMPGWQ